jgi:hypothetical protein
MHFIKAFSLAEVVGVPQQGIYIKGQKAGS